MASENTVKVQNRKNNNKNLLLIDEGIWGVRGAPEASRSIPERSLRSEDANIEKF